MFGKPSGRKTARQPKVKDRHTGRDDQHIPHELIDRCLDQQRAEVMTLSEPNTLQPEKPIGENSEHDTEDRSRANRHHGMETRTQSRQHQHEASRQDTAKHKTVHKRCDPSAFHLPFRQRCQTGINARHEVVSEDKHNRQSPKDKHRNNVCADGKPSHDHWIVLIPPHVKKYTTFIHAYHP